jgi:hypothetical protein
MNNITTIYKIILKFKISNCTPEVDISWFKCAYFGIGTMCCMVEKPRQYTPVGILLPFLL